MTQSEKLQKVIERAECIGECWCHPGYKPLDPNNNTPTVCTHCKPESRLSLLLH